MAQRAGMAPQSRALVLSVAVAEELHEQKEEGLLVVHHLILLRRMVHVLQVFLQHLGVQPGEGLRGVRQVEEDLLQARVEGRGHQGVAAEADGVHQRLRQGPRVLHADGAEVVGQEGLAPRLQAAVLQVDMASTVDLHGFTWICQAFQVGDGR